MSTPGSALFSDYFAEKPRNGLHKGPKFIGSGTKLVRMGDLFTFDRIRPQWDGYHLMELSTTELERHGLQRGDLLFCRTSVAAYGVGKCSVVVDATEDMVPASNLIRVRIDHKRGDPDFFHYYFTSPSGHSRLLAMTRGAAVFTITGGDIGSADVPDLPLKAQRTISAVLNTIDDLIENNGRRVALLERMAQAIYRDWFVHFRYPGHEDDELVDSPLGRIPAGWEVLRVEELATIVRGRSYRGAELVEEGGVPFINLKCMERGGGFRRDGLKRYSGTFKPDQVTQPGDIVLAVTDLTQAREILARATLVPRLSEGGAVISLDVARVVPNEAQDRLPLFAVLRYSDLSDRVKEFANGSTVLHLSPDHIAAADIVWPNESVRRRMNDLLGATYEMVEELNDAADRLASLRDLLLPKLVTGAIDVSHLDLDALLDGKASADSLSEGDN